MNPENPARAKARRRDRRNESPRGKGDRKAGVRVATFGAPDLLVFSGVFKRGCAGSPLGSLTPREIQQAMLGIALGVDSLLPDLVEGDPDSAESASAVCDAWVFLRRAQELVVELTDRLERAEGRPGVHVSREEGPRFDLDERWRAEMLRSMQTPGPAAPEPPAEEPPAPLFSA